MKQTTKFKYFQNLIKFIVILFTVSFLLTSCGLYKKTDYKTNPLNDADKRKKNMEEGRGFRIKNIGTNSGGTFQFASSNPMWRASLNVLDFIPLVNADYGGGIIITDWFNDDETDNSLKITIMFSSNEIRADGLDVIIHEKKCVAQSCTTGILASNLNNEIKIAILKKAARLQIADLKKSKN